MARETVQGASYGKFFCDTIFAPVGSTPGQSETARPEARLCFYDGKFIANWKATGTVTFPPGTSTNELAEDLWQRIVVAIASDTIDALTQMQGS